MSLHYMYMLTALAAPQSKIDQPGEYSRELSDKMGTSTRSVSLEAELSQTDETPCTYW